MTEATKSYNKIRRDFGKTPNFEDVETQFQINIMPDPSRDQTDFTQRCPIRTVLHNIPTMSEHSVNTERVATKNQGMKHIQGGWPKDTNYDEPNEVTKYMRRMNKEPQLGYAPAAKDLTTGATKSIRSNNEINMFEEYFDGEKPEIMSDTVTTQTIMIFKDPMSHGSVKRSVTKINWHPEPSEGRVAIAYAKLKFQSKDSVGMAKQAYIWNLNNPNTPEKTLDPISPLTTLAHNPKIPESIVGGCYDGSLCVFDLSKGHSSGVIKPVQKTELEKSHHDPVYECYWNQSGKAGKEFFSTSTDGQLLFWDMRKLETPVDTFDLKDKDQENNPHAKILGGTAMEYNTDAGPTKFLVGTEQGVVLLVSKRKKIETQFSFGTQLGAHHGPVYALERNPAHVKFFMSVGDWQAKIWADEGCFNPIMQTRYHQAYLTDGRWSPQRPGVFFLTRMDGVLDVWDFYYRQNELAYYQKVSDAPLTSIRIQQQLAAIGDSDGTVSLMHLCKALTEPAPMEKETMFQIFDREFRREKTLDQQKKLTQKGGPAVGNEEKARQKEQQIKDRLGKRLEEIKTTFWDTVGGEEEMAAESKPAAMKSDEQP